MGEHKYDITICKGNSPQEFKNICGKITTTFTEWIKKDLLIDVDGNTIQVYEKNGEKIVVYDDYVEGAVYVLSDVDIKSVIEIKND